MYNQDMAEQVLKGQATSWCGTTLRVEVRQDKQGRMYFQKFDTELPKKRVYLERVRDACREMLKKLDREDFDSL